MGHDAFISYSHAADSQLAPRLQDGLQRLAKPWWRRRSLHVFRDDTGLTANPGLWSSIVTAMDDSDWFVFLASPEAAESPWVQRELGHWLERNGPDKLLPVVTGGTWVWDSARDDFDMAASSAVPAVLAGAFLEEPRHVDMTWARSEDQVDLRNARFRDQVAEIGAPIHGMAKDDLEGADVREHRRTLRWAWGAAAALLVLTGLSVIAGLVAMRNADEAAAQRDEASMQRVSAEESAADAQQQQQVAEEERANAELKEAEALEAKNQADVEKQRAQRNEEAAREAEAETQDALANESAALAAEEEASARADEKAEEARANADEAATNADRAEAEARRAAANAADAIAKGELASANELKALANLDEANRQRAAAKASAQTAIASERQTQLALQSEKQAKAAETAAKDAAQRSAAEAQRSATEARAAQAAAEAAAEAEATARAAESEARQSAETEALASASAAQTGELSLLLGVEAARRSTAATTTGADGVNVFRTPTGSGYVVRAPYRVPDSVTGRRALFEAVAAAQGGADSYRIDRFLPFAADMADPPVSLWRPVVSANGRYLAAAEFPDSYRAARGPVPTRVFVWDLDSPTPAVKVLTGHTEQVVTLAFAGDGSTLVTQDVPFDLASGAPTTRVWDVASGQQLLEREALMFLDPTGEHIALQAWGLAEVEFVSGRTAEVEAVQPGFMATDPLTYDRAGGAQHPRYIESPFSADGAYAYGHSGGRAVLWDLGTGGRLTVPLASPAALWSTTPRVSPDGSGLAAAIENGTDLAFFDAASGTPLLSFPVTTGNVVSLQWNEDATRLAILDDQSQLIVLDNDTDGVNDTWATQVPLGEVGFDRTGRFVTVTVPVPGALSAYGTVVFDRGTGASLGLFDGQLVASRAAGAADLFFLRNDSTLAAVASADGRTVQADPVSDDVSAVAVSPEGHRLAVSTRSGVRVWDLSGDGPSVRTAATSNLTMGLQYRRGSEQLIGTGFGGVPVMWDLTRIGAGSPLGFASPDATILADGITVFEPFAAGTAVRFRNLFTGETAPGPSLQQGESVAYTLAGPEGGPLVVNLTDGTAVVADEQGSTIGRTPGWVATASRDGSRMALRGPGRTVEVVDTGDLSTVQTISLDALSDDDIAAQSDSVALDPDGSRLAATNGTGDTVVWDVGTGEVITSIPGLSADRISYPLWGLGFSPDGGRLVVKGASNTVRMYATGPGDEWELRATETLPKEFAGRVLFSPDGSLVAIDGLFLLDGETLRPIATLLAGPGSVTRFSSDGSSLATIAASGLEGPDDFREVVRWTVSIDELSAEACRIAARDLTIDEWNRYLGTSGEAYRRSCG